MLRKAPIILFVLGLMAFSFGYGLLVVSQEIFPYMILRDAKKAAEALLVSRSETPFQPGKYVFKIKSTQGGVTRNNPNKSFGGYTLFTAFDGSKCAHFLMGMDGEIVQEWYIPASRILPQKSESIYEAGDEWTCWQGKHLYANGELVTNMTGGGFPHEIGTIRLDRNSNVIWSLLGQTHHDVHLGSDGLLYIPSIRYHGRDEGGPFRIHLPGGDTYYWGTPVEENRVLVVSPAGDVLEDRSVLEAFSGSEYRGLFSINFKKNLSLPQSDDPTHLNNVELIKEDWARHYAGIEPGDIMVSLRNVSTLAIIDKKTNLVKWTLNGPFIRQHDPDLLPNGNILLFDNWGAPEEVGRSRVIEIDPRNQQIVWQYAGTVDKPLFSLIRGSQQLLPNGNVLITEPEGGRILEVTRDKEVVWEYINKLETTSGDNEVGIVIGAQRFASDNLTFLSPRD